MIYEVTLTSLSQALDRRTAFQLESNCKLQSRCSLNAVDTAIELQTKLAVLLQFNGSWTASLVRSAVVVSTAFELYLNCNLRLDCS
jgi:hypothetical protein